MPLIVNLSSVFKLNPVIPNGIGAFVRLCNLYSSSRCLCSKTLFGMSNYLWVLKQFYSNQKLINNYKLGKINKDQFLNSLLNIFSFLINNKKVDDPKKLLADAWNQIIAWDKQSTEQLEHLLTLAAQGEPIYLISNSNSLNVERILELFAQNCPGARWQPADLREALDKGPVQIAPRVFLCLSYRYGLFKEGTPGLLGEVAKQLEGQKLTVVSQYPKDLELAEKRGLRNIAADRFYPDKIAKPTRRHAF